MRSPRLLAAGLVLCLGTLAAAAQVPAAADQVRAAVLPLPKDLRDGATVLGYSAKGALTSLRKGTNGMTCLASDPKSKEFHVACYHDSMEPFMVRGRELRASGTKGPEVDSVRFREVKAGKIKMPASALLYSLSGGHFDAATGTAADAKPLFVVYLPGATPATTGLSPQPTAGSPWIMFPGTPKAHIMFIPVM